jgi:hypothetical protein
MILRSGFLLIGLIAGKIQIENKGKNNFEMDEFRQIFVYKTMDFIIRT